jgi:hypothetical protein
MSEKLISMVSHLGGPQISAVDIEWATDIPAGRRLIEWFTSQLDEGLTDEVVMRASLEMISLEEVEFQL